MLMRVATDRSTSAKAANREKTNGRATDETQRGRAGTEYGKGMSHG
jgi:hypothetical protein